MIPAVDFATTPRGAAADVRPRGKSARELARGFEELVLRQLIGAMRKTIPDSGTLEGGAARSTLDGVFEERLSQALAGGKGIGLADALLRQFERVTGEAARSPDGDLATSGSGKARSSASRAVAPVAGRVTSAFGPRPDPWTGETETHRGVDLAAPVGTPVVAMLDGEVQDVGWQGNAGQVVVVQHANGVVSRYAHLARAAVVPGESVAAGGVIGAVGTTGRVTGPHLHLAVEKDGQPVDPEPWITESRRVLGTEKTQT